VLDLMIDGATGVWHLANDGATSWIDLAQRVAGEAGLAWTHLAEANDGVARITALSSERGVVLPSLESGLSRYFSEREVDWSEPEHLVAAE
jgi:dTDP-4-dehydrorhamnose reductase